MVAPKQFVIAGFTAALAWAGGCTSAAGPGRVPVDVRFAERYKTPPPAADSVALSEQPKAADPPLPLSQSSEEPAHETRNQPYTAPGPAFRQLAVAAAAVVVSAMPQGDEAAQAQSESLVYSSRGPIGRLGVTAPPTSFANAVVGRPGTVRGPATALGFASRGNNLFSARANPASGPNGRCNELARAGFFGANRNRCEAVFRR